MNLIKTALIKCLIIISSIYIYGCYPNMSRMPHFVSYSGIDFTKYSALGFQITPESYVGQYESVGMLTAILHPAISPQRGDMYKKDLITIVTYDSSSYDGRIWYVERLDFNEVIDSLYNLSIRMGANAFTKFKIEVLPRANGPMLFDVIEVSGFAIKKIIKKAPVPEVVQ